MAYDTYTVRGGDSLSKIAQRLGLSGWQDLYNLNKSTIGGNPNYIRPGWQLNIPGTKVQQPTSQPVTQPLADQYASTPATQLERAAEIPQFENVMPFYESWEQLAPQAQMAAESQINPEAQRQFKSNALDYNMGMAGSGGQRFGRALGGLGSLKAAAERNRQAQVQDWMGAQRQGFENFFYNPSRDAWNTARTQGRPDDMVKPEIPTWDEYFSKYGNAYGAGSTSPFYG